jgi:formate/nitrite transporter FocA (FNT family)
MAVAPDPSEIFQRAVKEGERRLDQSFLELVATGFIAGLTIVFGIVALGIVHAVLELAPSGVTKIVGALAFGIGLVFLIVGRSELFSENFFDPVATVVERRRSGMLVQLLRLWAVTFVLNLVGGAVFALTLSVDGVLPAGTAGALSKVAEEIAGRGAWAGFVKAITGGALVTLLSFLLEAVDHVNSRIAMAYLVGFLLALGPFDHVVVTALHVFFGILFGAEIGVGTLAGIIAIVTAGNLVGGLSLVTLTHIAQAIGARQADD